MRNRFLSPFIGLVILLCCFLFSVSYAQLKTGNVIGKFTDEEGFEIPGAVVTIQGSSLMGSRTAITDEKGIYRFYNLPPGTYSIRIELPGFMTQTLKSIVVRIGENTLINITKSEISLKTKIKPPLPPPPPSIIIPKTKIKPSDVKKILDKEIKGLSIGKIMFNPPKEMTEYITERVETRITQNINEDLIRGLKGKGIPQIDDIEVSSSMTVKLSGDTFKISLKSEEEQPLLSSGYTQWEWDVTPQKAGSRKLQLSVSASIYTDQFGEKKKSHPVMEKEILVKVNPIIKKPKKSNFWKIIERIGIIAGVIATLLTIYFGLRRIARKRRDSP